MTFITTPSLLKHQPLAAPALAVDSTDSDELHSNAQLVRRVYIETMGCQMNVYDSERMVEALGTAGYICTDQVELADLAIVNTCSIRDKVEHKVVSLLGVWRKLKEHNPDLVLGVAGCVAQQEGDKLLAAVPYLDLVVGPDQIAALPTLVQERRDHNQRGAATAFVHRNDYEFPTVMPPNDGRVTSMVTVMKGCNKVCAFCIVPFTRGREVSKPAQQVVDEVRMLCANGVREVTLLGQNVNSYGKDRSSELDFAELIYRVAEVEDLQRIRFTTSHPMDCTDALIEAFANCPKLMPFFHLPIQSGSATVLKAMRRHHGVDDYLEKITKLRTLAPHVALSTDIIVGFPTETAQDFAMTLDLLRQVGYASLYSFLYSARPGTRAAQLADDVPLAEKKRRIIQLQKVQDGITAQWMQGFAGATVQVLLEGPSRIGSAGPDSQLGQVRAQRGLQLVGRTPQNVKVNVAVAVEDLTRLTGQTVAVRIERVGPHSLSGTVVGQHTERQLAIAAAA